MKNYLTIYSEILESGHALMGQVYKEFRHNFTELSTTKLLETFIHSKATGTNRPGKLSSDYTVCCNFFFCFVIITINPCQHKYNFISCTCYLMIR